MWLCDPQTRHHFLRVPIVSHLSHVEHCTLPQNISQVPIFLELKRSDPLFDVKCTFYRRDLSIPYRRVRVCVSDNENTRLLLALLRVIEADR